jgi:hypothetical protein
VREIPEFSVKELSIKAAAIVRIEIRGADKSAPKFQNLAHDSIKNIQGRSMSVTNYSICHVPMSSIESKT